ncbi:MAG: 6,7-dimethyl-8-ribityllumazine synthase [Alphaproteobacteria bacterium]
MRIAIIKAKWNSDITAPLAADAKKTLLSNHFSVKEYEVPGAVELAIAAKNIINKTKVDAVICIGAVILGETDHYHYVAKMAADGINQVALETATPVLFGVLTCPNRKLAMDRVDGTHSRCGIEWANAAMEMVNLIEEL